MLPFLLSRINPKKGKPLAKELTYLYTDICSSHTVWLIACFTVLIAHGLLAEDILLAMKEEGYHLGWFFSCLSAGTSFLISCYFSGGSEFYKYFSQRICTKHIVSGLSFSIGQGLAGTSQLFLHYNTITIFKSCKLVFVMLTSKFLLNEPLTRKAALLSFVMALGLIILSQSDMKNTKDEDKTDSFFGLFLITSSLGVASIGNVVQQAALQNVDIRVPVLASCKKNKKENNFTKEELKENLLLYSSFVTFVCLFLVCLSTGEISQGVQFFLHPQFHSSFTLMSKQLVALVLLASGQRLILSLSQIYGATLISLFSTVRKVSSFVLSVFFFPKPFNMGHGFGVIEVTIAALFLQQHLREMKRQKDKQSKGSSKRRNDSFDAG
eukprot:maker-scaffold_7-snap-gene-15.44-mRNA-1 protein AED:0.13 eAED:0.13 QI:155/0.66/0.5/1/1/1/4/0/380